jgi:aminoglycoside phosphotransferase (APT) family kinase protein
MTTLILDTHDFIRRLHDAGFSEEQAKILTKLQQESVGATLNQVHSADAVTKHDLRETKLKLEIKVAETKAELVRWIVAAGFVQTALITALLLKLSSGL